jgi:uncharacterized membrane protein
MRIRSIIGWVLLLTMGIIAVLAPCAVLAQVPKPGLDLTLNIVYDNFNSLKAGEQRTVFLEVANYGTRELTDIRLSSESPEGWTVEITPAVIDSLSPEGVQTVEINLRPPEGTGKGPYNIAIIAQTEGIRRVTSIYLQVESGSLFWVWVAVGMAALLIGGFVFIFMRFGREEK